jgi:hypothetical protein
MAKNLYETADDTLRGEAQGQLSPEAQSLWDRYNTMYGQVANAPMRKLNLRSGASMDIPDPGFMLKQAALRKVLGGAQATGLGTRAKPQPGVLAQMAPFITALGSDPKFMKWLSSQFGGGKGMGSADPSGFNVGSSVNDDWWSGQGGDAIDAMPIDYYDTELLDNDWGWLD